MNICLGEVQSANRLGVEVSIRSGKVVLEITTSCVDTSPTIVELEPQTAEKLAEWVKDAALGASSREQSPWHERKEPDGDSSEENQ